jgi:preprotein translocase subunit SecA
MVEEIRDDTVRDILSVVPREKAEERKQVYKIAGTTGGDGTLKKKPVVNKEAKVGRNDPCPCGSGKKYKKCCGA